MYGKPYENESEMQGRAHDESDMHNREDGPVAKVKYTDEEAAGALLVVIPESTWEAVAFAHAYVSMRSGAADEEAARLGYDKGMPTLTRSLKLLEKAKTDGFISCLSPRKKIGKAENPVTKLFPAAITEQRFIELLDELTDAVPGLSYSDDREGSHTLTDFTLHQDRLQLPMNVKNAGTVFMRAKELVGLEPEDCIPIPAYKAHAALERVPDLLYVVSVDYELITSIESLLPRLFDRNATITWELLNRFSGARVRSAEDAFILTIVRKHWVSIKKTVQGNPFHVISARKAIRILQRQPRRTPGIGMRAWGTGATGEVNVHISIRDETVSWNIIRERICSSGVGDIIKAVNRKRTETVYDPEI